MKREDLIEAGKDLNALGILDPEIEIDADNEELKKQILEAAECLEEGDEITEETKTVIQSLKDGEEIEPDDDATGEEGFQESEDAVKTREAADKKGGDDLDALTEDVNATKKLADLKDMVGDNEVFKPLRKKLDDFKGMTGPRELKAEMLALIAKAGNKKGGAPEKKKDTGPKKSESRDFSTSNKAIVYRAWKKGEKDIEKLVALTSGAIKSSTVKGWISAWGRGENLPAIAKKA